jgi:gamma-glutamylcyclotransferase (GGCT)/AIG2-like uncharacterized protein YtfP
MENNCRHLFIYGTLLSIDNEFGALLKQSSTPVSKGSFPGLLYDLGDYPGAIFDAASRYTVYGSIILLKDEPDILKTIDEYEGYDDTEEQPNLFIRKIVSVKTNTTTKNCWVYLYNLPLTGFKEIKSGIYQ